MFDLEIYNTMLNEAISFLKEEMEKKDYIGIMAGTGLGDLGAVAEVIKEIPYSKIPFFPVSTVSSHAGSLLVAKLNGKDVVIFQGRFHLYEGYEAHEVVFPIRVLHKLGMNGLILTNAAGGLNLDWDQGDIMLIEDQINMMGTSCLVGPHDDKWGDRFPDMSMVYDRELMAKTEQIASAKGITLRKGVYVSVKGPNLETRAETRCYRGMGADAIGMSTVQEAIASVQAGIKLVGFSVCTNMNNPDDMRETSLQDVIDAANKTAPILADLVSELIAVW